MPRTLPTAVLLASFSLAAQAQTSGIPIRVLHSTPGHDARKQNSGEAYPDTNEVVAALQLRLREADPTHPGHIWLQFSADTGPNSRAAHLLIRVPLSASGIPTPGQSTCTVNPQGDPFLTFTASPDPKNFVPFQPAASTTNIELSLNTYLCQALAASYTCNGTPHPLTIRWPAWKLARTAQLLLTGEAPATLDLSPVAILATDQLFPESQCPKPKP